MEESTPKVVFKITVERINQYKTNPVYFMRPTIVAVYDCAYEKISTAKSVKYFREPDLNEYPINLNVDINSFIGRCEATSERHLNCCLKYCMSAAAQNYCLDNVEETKVITRGSVLRKIMGSHYMRRDFEGILVSRYNGNLYISFENTEPLMEKTNVYTHHSRLTRMLLVDLPGGKPTVNEIYDENIVQRAVRRAVFGKYHIIYSGELQGIIDEKEITDLNDLDVLNNRPSVLVKQMWKFLKRKESAYLKIWLQSYLSNIRHNYIGFKNWEGVIEEPIKHISTNDIYKMNSWKPYICTGILYDFLEKVEELMSSVNCKNTVYCFNYDGKENLFSCKIFNGKTDKTFITEEYLKYCKEHA